MKQPIPPFSLLAILPVFLLCCGMPRPVSHLQGTWRMIRPSGGEHLEVWTKTTPGALSGRGLRVTGGDTVLLETLTLHNAGGTWQYIAEVPDQNEGKPVAFACTHRNRTEMVFTNSRHDFPQRIRYRLVRQEGAPGVDSLIVTLGTIDDDMHMLRFARRP